MSLKILFITLLVVLCFASSSPAAEIVVSAAASLTEAFTEAKAAFQIARPDLTVTSNFAASGQLLRQIEQGAPVDVFASADQETMDKAAASGLIVPDTRTTFAGNSLVLVAPAGDSGMGGLKDLAGAGKVAMGNPESVPVGRYAREALTAAGLWDSLQTRLILGNSVKQVLDYAARGEVDAAVVFATDARSAGSKVRVVEELSGHRPVTYPMAVVAASGSKDAARAFVAFMAGPEGRRILEGYGFRTEIR